MKQILLLSFSLLISCAIFSQNQIFISEYVEGSGNNRAIELYNPNSTPVLLQDSGYRLVRYSNGDGEGAGTEVVITGTIPANGTWVAVSDKRDPSGTGYDTMVDPALQAKADTFLCPVYSVNKMMYFNGNDAVTLEKANGVYVDIFGEIGVDPGDAWTMDANAGYTSALGGRWWTKNKTLVRKPTVTSGVTTIPSPFIVGTEWDSLPKNTFDYLGSHPHNISVEPVVKKQNDAFFYPNPSTNGWFMVKGSEVITSVEVFNVVGKVVISKQNPVKRGDMKITTESLDGGIYFVNILFADNTSITKKIVIR